jgi:hypothetical protein
VTAAEAAIGPAATSGTILFRLAAHDSAMVSVNSAATALAARVSTVEGQISPASTSGTILFRLASLESGSTALTSRVTDVENAAGSSAISTRVVAMWGTENARWIIPYARAATVCPSGTPIHSTRRNYGLTGSQICAGDSRLKTTCTAVIFLTATIDGNILTHTPTDGTCGSPVYGAWPWGSSYSVQDSLPAEWAHPATWVVCCA